MQYKISEEHSSNNLSPLTVKKGTKVRLGEMSDGVEIWPNWIHCCTLDGKTEGWTPIQIIQIENEYGIVLEDYSAKELDVEKGEIVEGSIELNGWIWCNKLNRQVEGWIPKEKMTILDSL